MNIVHLSNTPLSNSPSNLANAQRAAGHDAVVYLHRQSNTNKVFVGGQLWNQMNPDALTESIRKADVIHFHNYAFELELFRHYPHLADICRTKSYLIQYHSPRNSTENFDATLTNMLFKGRRAVIAQYHVRQYPEAEYIVPNIIPLFDPTFMPLKTKPFGFLPLISFAPSNVNLRGWDDKGFELTSEIFRRLEYTGKVRTEVIVNTPFADTMIKKKWADIGVDEVVTGSYHMSFLEYMAMGVTAVCGMDDATRAAMSFVIGWDAVNALPSIYANPRTLELEIMTAIADPAHLRARGAECRQWMETHWNPNTFVKYFQEIYEKV